MKAAVLHGKEEIRVEAVTPQPLRAGEVRVRIEVALTCGTDLKVYKRGYHARMIVPPATFGHEFAGVISEVAPDVTGWAVCDRVVAANSAPCGECYYCCNRQENLCDDLLFLNGAYARSIVVPARLVQKNLLRLKAETDFRDAALVEPLACVVQGIEDTQLCAGQRVLVIGAGPIGLMFLAVARHLGCIVTVAGRGAQRLATARRLGAQSVFNVSRSGGLEAVVPPGMVFDAVIEAVGKPETYSNLKLLASFHHTPRVVRRALSYIEAGIVRAVDFVDRECSLTELPTVFQAMATGNQAVKTLVRVHE
jgi:L-iditol 2-dehydrogenase